METIAELEQEIKNFEMGVAQLMQQFAQTTKKPIMDIQIQFNPQGISINALVGQANFNPQIIVGH